MGKKPKQKHVERDGLAEVQIGRTNCSHAEDYIHIRIRQDDLQPPIEARFIRLSIPLDKFSLILTGLGGVRVPCTMTDRYLPEVPDVPPG